MERFFPSRVIKMQYKLQNLHLQFDRKKEKKIEKKKFFLKTFKKFVKRRPVGPWKGFSRHA